MAASVIVAYSGIHQAFQIALAAEEAGLLEKFYCSVFDGPGKWGAILSRIFGRDTLVNRRVDGLPGGKIVEYPWPLLRHRLHAKLRPGIAHDWLHTQEAFDYWSARQLERSSAPVFVGTETCAQRCFEVCARYGILRVLDCPQLHPRFLTTVLDEAAERAGLCNRAPVDTPGMAARKSAEFAAADRLLIYSEVHRRSFLQAGIPEQRLFECPLWVDPALWWPDPARRPSSAEKLRVLFVGGINLRKGVPFLLEAARKLAHAIDLTLVGAIAGELRPMLDSFRGPLHMVAPQTRAALRSTFSRHDLLVLPSVADSFGFVALEAMACGLPVIVTENCGVPVPDPAWRVPVMDTPALADRIAHYVQHREAIATDGELARSFAARFTPERYRQNIGSILRSLVSGNAESACVSKATRLASSSPTPAASQVSAISAPLKK